MRVDKGIKLGNGHIFMHYDPREQNYLWASISDGGKKLMQLCIQPEDIKELSAFLTSAVEDMQLNKEARIAKQKRRVEAIQNSGSYMYSILGAPRIEEEDDDPKDVQ